MASHCPFESWHEAYPIAGFLGGVGTLLSTRLWLMSCAAHCAANPSYEFLLRLNLVIGLLQVRAQLLEAGEHGNKGGIMADLEHLPNSDSAVGDSRHLHLC